MWRKSEKELFIVIAMVKPSRFLRRLRIVILIEKLKKIRLERNPRRLGESLISGDFSLIYPKNIRMTKNVILIRYIVIIQKI